jgi:hypothetical protein
MYAQFVEATGMASWDDKPVTDELALRNVKLKLGEALGIEELTKLRSQLIRLASS